MMLGLFVSGKTEYHWNENELCDPENDDPKIIMASWVKISQLKQLSQKAVIR